LLIDDLVRKYDARKPETMRVRYEQILVPIREKVTSVLELGIFQGGSLNVWRELFPNAAIVGIDTNHYVVPQQFSDRITSYKCDQANTVLLSEIALRHASDGFDVIIDDCSHVGSLTRASFVHLFRNHLKNGGIYFIEDWGVSYQEGPWEGSQYSGSGHMAGIAGMVKDLIDEIHVRSIFPENTIDSILVSFDFIVVIKRSA